MIFSHQGAVRVEQPFQMTVSRGCIGYYRSYDLTMKRDWEDLIGDKDRDEGNVFRPGGLEEIAQGRGRCPQCSVLVSFNLSPFIIILLSLLDSLSLHSLEISFFFSAVQCH